MKEKYIYITSFGNENIYQHIFAMKKILTK